MKKRLEGKLDARLPKLIWNFRPVGSSPIGDLLAGPEEDGLRNFEGWTGIMPNLWSGEQENVAFSNYSSLGGLDSIKHGN